MSDGFNVKNTVRRIKPDLFSALLSRHSISMNVDWNASAFKYRNDVFMNYMLMDDADHKIIEPELVEIGTFAAWAGARRPSSTRWKPSRFPCRPRMPRRPC